MSIGVGTPLTALVSEIYTWNSKYVQPEPSVLGEWGMGPKL